VERKLTAAVREGETQKRLLQEQTLEIASLQKAKTKAVTEINEVVLRVCSFLVQVQGLRVRLALHHIHKP